ncbi:MAG: hypothetical protein DRH57_09445 [Candidatus Cloacimonadota bacterium]|nr:MAG: hypothetical protein DRH57_09445 [Candidatus Cloacimonadota bacterium]
MSGRLLYNKKTPKRYRKIIAFIKADDLNGIDVRHLENYLEQRNDLHYIYLIVSEKPTKNVITVCNRYKHLKLIYTINQDIEIANIKNQFDEDDVKFEERELIDVTKIRIGNK